MLKNILNVFIGIMLSLAIHAQAVVLERSAELMNEMYTIEGTAFLEELDNGILQLRLSDDFSTPSGPDVRIFLNNSISATGAIEVVNLSDINHFNGALTVEVPAGVDIDDYQYIVFFCFQFQQLWASGEWSDSAPPGGGFDCENSDVTLSNGTATIDVCPTDGISDLLTFVNSLDLPATTNYAYLLTDENEILQQVITGDNYDFEGTSMDEQRIYGIHYDGTLQPAIGSIRSATSASGCFTHSSILEYIEITKNACPTFECLLSNTFTTNGSTLIDICPTDGIADDIVLLNSLNENPGDQYAYLITNENQTLQDVIYTSNFNFEGSVDSEQRVYGIHFDGNLNPVFGSVRQMTTASGCFTHSNDGNFLTITKGACPPDFVCEENSTGSADGNEIDICPSDGIGNTIEFTNDIDAEVGTHYAYLITDENEILQEIVLTSSFDFEGTNEETQRIYGIHFDGDLIPQIGQTRINTSASGCFQHSANSIYVTITKNACPPEFICLETSISTDNSNNSIDICPSDSQDDIIALQNNQAISAGLHFAYLITDINENVIAFTQTNNYNFEGSSDLEERVYGIHFEEDLNVMIGENRMQTTSSGCFEHSSDEDYLTITKNACPPPFECLVTSIATTDWASEIDICPSDGADDIVELRNNLMIDDPNTYAYLITDENEVVLDFTHESEYNFEGESEEPQRVYGIHYESDLVVMIGQNRNMTTATGCFEHSSSELFLTITKNSCLPAYECSSSLTATTDWATVVEICPTDDVSDIIELRNNLMIPVGAHYAYLLTDADQILQEVILDSLYDFEGSDLTEQRVYGINYDGELDAKIGEDRLETTSSGCYIHSGDNLFLTINKTGCVEEFECVESLTASFAWVTNIDICANDGIADEILIQNNIDTEPGEHYAFLLTDSSEILLEVFFDSIYNFEGLEEDVYRVYGLSYAGQLDPAIGEDRKNTTATDCYTHSGDNLFITINTKAECVVATEDISVDDIISIYPNPSNGLIQLDFNIADIEIIKGAVYDMNGSKIMDFNTDINHLEIEKSGIYIIQFSTEKDTYNKKIVVNR